MAKILTDMEMADIVRRAVEDKTLIEDADSYRHFLEDLGELICTHFGGERGTVSGPDYPREQLGRACVFRIKDYDTDVVWQHGKEVQA